MNTLMEPVLKPDQHEYHTGHVGKVKFQTETGPLTVAHRPGTPLLSTQTNQIALAPQRARVYSPPPPAVMRYTLHYSKIENYYGMD